MNIQIHDHALIIEHGGVSLRTVDTVNGSFVFHSASGYQIRGGVVCIDSCPVSEDGVPLHGLIAHYRFTENGPHLHAKTWFTAGESCWDYQVKWMHLQLDDSFERLTGKNPDYELPMSEAERDISFIDSLTLHGKHSVTLSGCAEPYYSPARNVLIPFADLAGVPMDLRLIDEAHPICFTLSVDAPAETLETEITSAVCRQSDLELKAGNYTASIRRVAGGVLINDVPLFTMCVQDDTERILSAERGWRTVRIEWQGNTAVILLEDHEDIPELAVTLRGFSDGRRITWNLSVSNTNEQVSVMWITWPPLVLEGVYDGLTPSFCGTVYPDWGKRDAGFVGRYPSGFATPMQFMAFLNQSESLYAGIHDPRGCVKQLSALSAGGRITMAVRVYAENMGAPANAFNLSGDLVWEAFSGGWYEAAQLYRAFAVNTPWYPNDGMARIPEWMRKTPFWIMDWMPNENPDADPIPISIRPLVPSDNPRAWIDDALMLREKLGVPIGYHLYNWHWIPFNNDFPHYFPPKSDFEAGVKELEANDVHVMPYINALLWDTRDKRGEDAHFTQQALASASKNADGSLIWSSYASHEPDGELCKLAHMCPTTAVWQRKVRSIVEKLTCDYGVSAVYLDQISAHMAELCMDPTHPHLPGGGSYWNEGYARLLDGLRTRIRPGAALTSESNAEVYNRWLDGYLTWCWISSRLVPIFQTVYAGTVIMFGRNTNGYKKADPVYRRCHYAQSLITGQVLGWSNADVCKDDALFPFLKSCVDARVKWREVFEEGCILPPCEISGNIPYHTCIAGMNRSLVERFELVNAMKWNWNGKTVTFVTNASDETVDCTVDSREMTLTPLSVNVFVE